MTSTLAGRQLLSEAWHGPQATEFRFLSQRQAVPIGVTTVDLR